MKHKPIFHPYLIAIYPVFYLYSRNEARVPVQETFLPVVILLLAAFVLVRVSWKSTSSKEAAAVLVSTFFLWLFSYSAIRGLITFDVCGIQLYRHRIFASIWLVILGILCIALYAARSRIVRISQYFSVFAVALMLVPVLSILSYALNHQGSQPESSKRVQGPSNPLPAHSDSLPDVYYIILDAYTGETALKRYLGIDNSELTNDLRRRGFYVAANSHSNYSWTGLSVGSSLNMEYLPMHRDPAEPDRALVEMPASEADLIGDNKVARSFRQLGYDFVDLSFWRNDSAVNSHGSVYGFLTSDFNLEILRMTVLNRPLVIGYLFGNAKREMVSRTFEELRNLPAITRPRFVYAHFLIPHHPYVFDENGNAPSFFEMFSQMRSEKDLYRRQLQYASKEILQTIDMILTSSMRRPIIIVQGDHGAYRLGNPENEFEQIRMSILNAYLVPESARKQLYDSISPVNTFRLIFDACYGQHNKLLPDESYLSDVEDIHAVRRVATLMTR